MALSIRLSRGGRRNIPFYRIVVADSRKPRDGRYIERLGTYNPRLEHSNEQRVVLVKERIEYWLSQGAKPSERVAIFLGKAGMIDMPKQPVRPNKSQQSEKTKMRIEEKTKKREAAAEAAKAAAEEAKAAEAAAREAAKAAAEAPAPAPEATPAEEAPAEEAPAEEAPAAEAAPAEAEAAPAAEEPKAE
jgi:small subunit ribosomal protein S16